MYVFVIVLQHWQQWAQICLEILKFYGVFTFYCNLAQSEVYDELMNSDACVTVGMTMSISQSTTSSSHYSLTGKINKYTLIMIP